MAVAVAALAAPAWAGRSVSITAKSAILMDPATGELIWSHNPDLPLPPASTTKVVTATLALKSGRLDEAMRVSDRAAQEPPSKINLRSGWAIHLRDLVYAVLLNSANDASVVVAEGLAGTVRQFAARMNVHAYAVGAKNTHFVNPNGLPADDHYSSARDLGLLFRHALQYPEFREVLTTQTTTIVPATGSVRPISLHTHNRMLTGHAIPVIGKTGWTRAAGKCFVGAGNVDGREVIVALLGSSNLWGDLKRLMDFAYDRGPEPNVGETRVAKVSAPWPVAKAAGDDDEAIEYRVQLATYRSKNDATTLQKRVRGMGFPAAVASSRQKGKTTYRVSIGGFSSRKSAERAARSVGRKIPSLKPQIVAS